MKGDDQILELLNDLLTAELTVINQYYVHYKMCENWGFKKLAEHTRAESIEEMQHADKVIERILFLDGIPNMQRLNSVKVGETVPEQFQLALDAESEQRERLNEGIALCLQKKDGGTRELLEHILEDEEESIDWLEANLGLIETVGLENYLAEKL